MSLQTGLERGTARQPVPDGPGDGGAQTADAHADLVAAEPGVPVHQGPERVQHGAGSGDRSTERGACPDGHERDAAVHTDDCVPAAQDGPGVSAETGHSGRHAHEPGAVLLRPAAQGAGAGVSGRRAGAAAFPADGRRFRLCGQRIFVYKSSEKHRNYVRTCSYLVLFLSYDTIITTQLVTPLDRQYYATLPQHFRLSGSPTTYRDFLVTQTCAILQTDCPLILVPTMIEWIYNMVPQMPAASSSVPTTNRRPSSRDLATAQPQTLQMSYSTCSAVTQLVAKFSSVEFLSQQDVNLDLLALLMRSLCHVITRNPNDCAIWFYVLLKNKPIFENVIVSIRKVSETSDCQDETEPASGSNSPSPTLNAETSEDDPLYRGPTDDSLIRPKLPVGMSFRAKAKLPLNAPLELTWPGLKATTVVLDIIRHLEANVTTTGADAASIINQINGAKMAEFVATLKLPNEYNPAKTKFEPLRFTWSNLSLGWYTSVLWCLIYNQLEVCKSKSVLEDSISAFKKVGADWGFGTWSTFNSKSSTMEIHSLSPIGIWDGTDVKLFTIKGATRDVPLTGPKNSVDMATDSFIKRFGSIALNRRKSSAASLQTLSSQTQQAHRSGTESPGRPLLSRGLGSTDNTQSTPPLVNYSPVPPPVATDFEGFNLNSFGKQPSAPPVPLKVTPRNSLSIIRTRSNVAPDD
ncbi:hypothetical protein KL941_000324 [Ogataea angusta]|nr:hypothetical protein KL941_000324 [Ogataea angusta]